MNINSVGWDDVLRDVAFIGRDGAARRGHIDGDEDENGESYFCVVSPDYDASDVTEFVFIEDVV